MKSRAFWIDPTGAVHAVGDTHLLFAKMHAPLFGFNKAEAATWSEDDREHVLPRAFKMSWIRIRLYADGWHAQGGAWDADKFVRLVRFLTRDGAWPQEPVRVVDERGDLVFVGTVADLRERVKTDGAGT